MDTGTHIAGTIAEGTPSNVKIYPVKASDSGEISNLYIIMAINYIVLNDKANVINMSFGSYEYDSAMYSSIKFATANNIICVAAAGNDNKADPSYPAAFDNTISIAACDSSLKRASFSNYNPTVTFTAPGVDIRSINGTSSGTSMATPHAAAAIAILKSYNINYTLEDIICILRKYAIDLGEVGKDDYFGYGFISFKTVSYCTCNCIDCDKIYCFNCECENCIFNHNVSTVKKIEIDSPFLVEDNLLEYNYGSLTNLSNLQLKIYYNDDKYIKRYLLELDGCEITGYNPYCYTEQTVTVKYGGKQTSFTIEQEEINSGWEYTAIDSEHIKLTAYKPTTYHKGKDLEKIYVPENIDGLTVTALGSSLFADTTLKSIILPDSLNEIGDYAFSNCTNLASITIPENVTKIGTYAFQSCTKIQNIFISENIVDIGNYAFYKCINIENFVVAENNTYYDSRDNSNSLINSTTNTLLFGTKNTIIPHSISSLGEYAFAYNTYLTSLIIPNNITEIKDYAFYNCNNIEELIGLKNVVSIGNNSFNGISNLTLAIFDDTYSKTYADTKALTYAYLDFLIPIETTYTAFDTVNTENLVVSLIKDNSTIEAINSGFTITYPNNNTSFRYGDTSFNISFTSQILGNFEEAITVTINNPPKTSVTPNITVTQKTYDGELTLDATTISISNLQTTDYTIESATTVSANVRKHNS